MTSRVQSRNHKQRTGPSTRQSTILSTIDPRLLLLAALLIISIVVFSMLAPGFGSVGNLLDIGAQSATLIVVSVGLTFVLIVGELDLSVGAIAALVSIIVAQSVTAWELSATVAVLLGLLAGTGIGAINASLTLGLKIPSFLATLAMLGVVQGLALTVNASPVSVRSGALGSALSGDLLGIPLVLLYAVAVAAAAAVLLRRSRFGLWLRATGSSTDMARLVGLPVIREKFTVLMISGLCSAAGGIILVGRTGFGDALSMPGLMIDALAAVILGGTLLGGGRGTIIGTLLSALLIGVITSGIQAVGLPSSGQDITRGIIIGVAVLLMRQPRRKELSS